MDEPIPNYEKLCRCLYAWHFGSIDFLELVRQIEVELGICPSDELKRTDNQLAAAEAEAE